LQQISWNGRVNSHVKQRVVNSYKQEWLRDSVVTTAKMANHMATVASLFCSVRMKVVCFCKQVLWKVFAAKLARRVESMEVNV